MEMADQRLSIISKVLNTDQLQRSRYFEHSWQVRVAFGLRLEPSFMSLPGLCEGHMIEEGDHLLLLSQAVQAKLGMVKDVRDGTICMKDMLAST